MLRTIFSIGFLQVIGILISIARSKIFALLLGPAGFGVVATIDQLVTAASQLSNFGLPFTALKFLSRGHSLGEDFFRKIYSAFLKAMAVLAFLATFLAIIFVPGNLANLDPQLAKYRGPVFIALLGIPATMLLVFFVNVLAARQKTMQSILLTTLSSSLLMVFGWIGCLLGGVQGIYLATVPASTALIVGMVIFARVKMNLPVNSRSVEVWKGLRSELKANAAIFETAIATYLAVGAYSALLLAGRYECITRLGEEAAGLLQAGLAVALSIATVLGPANSLYLAPFLNRAIPARDKAEAANRFLPALILFFCLGSLPVLLFPELALRVLFSDRFTTAAALLPWFIAWQFLHLISNVYQQLLIGLDDVKACCLITALGHLVAAALCLALTGPLGLLGIGAAFVVGGLFIGCLTAFRLTSKHRLAVPKSIPALAAFVILSFSSLPGISRMTGEMTLPGIGARSLIAVVFFAALWFMLPQALRSDLAGFRLKQIHRP